MMNLCVVMSIFQTMLAIYFIIVLYDMYFKTDGVWLKRKIKHYWAPYWVPYSRLERGTSFYKSIIEYLKRKAWSLAYPFVVFFITGHFVF